MYRIPNGLALPSSLAQIDASFMTRLLRARGVIGASQSVVSMEESDVGMTAGYFSAIKRLKCTYSEATDAPRSFIAKAWPEFEIAPRPHIQAMFKKDIGGHLLDAASYFPRPKVYLADYDLESNCWCLIMEDANTFAEHKVHEHDLSFDEVMRMVPKLAEVAAAWEGCVLGPKADKLDALGVQHWASDENLALFRMIMPSGAKLVDKITSMASSSLIEGPTWDVALGPKFAELFTEKLEAFFGRTRPEKGATTTLCHGDMRGDNIFFCDSSERHPDGWLAIDYQLMFRGPVPSDLAYLMTSATVSPQVFTGQQRQAVKRAFYECFMKKTKHYKDYTWEQFELEYSVMSTVLFVYFVGFGAAIWCAGATANQHPARVELGGQGAKLEDLAPGELRKRMWWRKSFTNFRTSFEADGLYARLKGLPKNQGAMAEWFELPAHLK